MEGDMVDMEAQMKNRNNIDEDQRDRSSSSPSAIFEIANRPVTLKFEDVIYTVKIKKGGMFRKNSKSEEKVILKGVTGIVKPGEILAMLGPSGSGKTTLLTALGGRLGGRLQGSITYNGETFSNKMKRRTGFVTQDDVLYPHLTVTETLVFTALLRLPNTLARKEKILNAEAVISQLGLTRCKNSIIGGPFLRGVSGGERKRVSIGQEMLINPSLLFLDEPTSGLDSTTAQRIVSTLSELANGGRTIVMTIHQPSSRIFYLFKKVLLLSEGNLMYLGKGDQVMGYFSSIGFAPSVAMNPSDFLLDLANGISPDDSMEDQPAAAMKEKLVSAYKSNLSAKVKEECLEYNKTLAGDPGVRNGRGSASEDKNLGKWPTTWCQQFSVLLTRGLKERRHEAFDFLKIAQVLVSAVLSGFLWLKSSVPHIQDQVGLLFFYTTFWGFFALFQAIFTFPKERMMLSKERASGMYRLSSYFFSRTAADLPMELILPTVFLIIVYWMTGLKPNAGSFFYNLSVLLLNVLVAQGLGLALGAFCLDQQKATVLGSVLMLAFMLAGGFYVQNVPGFIAWIKYLSVSQYAFKLLLGSQYGYDDTYPCGGDGSQCLIREIPAVKTVGLDGQLGAAVSLIAMFVGYRLLAYIALMRIGRSPA